MTYFKQNGPLRAEGDGGEAPHSGPGVAASESDTKPEVTLGNQGIYGYPVR